MSTYETMRVTVSAWRTTLGAGIQALSDPALRGDVRRVTVLLHYTSRDWQTESRPFGTRVGPSSQLITFFLVPRRNALTLLTRATSEDVHPGASADCRLPPPATSETAYSPTPAGRLALSCAEHSRQTASNYSFAGPGGMIG